MSQRVGAFIGGLLAGLLAAGIILLIIARPRGQPILLREPPTPQPLRIHVAGAVMQPGVYSLPPGSIVQDAILAAGGAQPQAGLDGVNLADVLEDGQRVLVASPLDTDGAMPTQPAAASTPASPVCINTATEPELELLPGIGPSLASAIVEYRQTHGLFRSVDELLDVPGIGAAKLALIRPLVTLD